MKIDVQEELRRLRLRISLLAKPTNFAGGALRPISPKIYSSFFDTTLNKPLWWNGTEWRDAAGTIIT